MVKEPYPFTEFQECENTFIRTFSKETDQMELKWHFDEEDRIMESISPTDWEFQFDNKLPQVIKGKIFIPKGVWHRIIKGSDDLEIRLVKMKNK
jgi:hypothetical protein